MLLLLLIVVRMGICTMAVFVMFSQSILSKKRRPLRLHRDVATTNFHVGSTAPGSSDSPFVLGFIDERLCDNCYVEHECSCASQKIPDGGELTSAIKRIFVLTYGMLSLRNLVD